MVLGVIAAAVAALNYQVLGIGIFGILSVYVGARALMSLEDRHYRRIRKEEKRALKGAKAEEKIGDLLAPLDESFLVIHDISSPHGNIDHVVISEMGGVFLVETKSHGGRVTAKDGRLLLNGHVPEKDFIAQTLQNTYWLREKVKAVTGVEAWINPILVFTNAFVDRMEPIKGIRVVNKRYFVQLIRFAKPSGVAVDIWRHSKALEAALLAERN